MPPENIPQYFGKDLEAMSFAKNYHRWILSEFAPYLGNAVAEVGAGVGSFSTLLLETNIASLMAFEPSHNMYPILQKTLRADHRATAINGFFDGRMIEQPLDSVLYVNVLEHIEDDAAELTQAYAAIKPGGHLLVFVPALPCLYSQLDEDLGHFRRYLKQDLVELTQHAGFSILKAHYFDIAGIIPWYINFVLLKNSISSGGVSLYDRFVVPAMRFIETHITPPIGKNILLIAKKSSASAG